MRMFESFGRFGKRVGHHAKELLIAFVFAVLAAVGYEWWHAREREHAIDRARAAVVTITAYDATHKAIAQGSGVFITASGVLATNYRVIEGAAEIEAQLPSGAFYRLEEQGIRFSDAANDIVLLDFDSTNTPHVGLGNPQTVRAGQTAYVIGTPDGQASSVSFGNISHPDRVVAGRHLIQFTAAISHGSSGGGLFAEDGTLVGIASYSKSDPLDQNLNYAIPITYVRAALAKEATITKGSPSYYYVQGNLAGDRHAWDLAVKHYSKAIDLNPRYAEAYTGRGTAYFELGEYERQLNDYQKASEIAPNNPQITLYLGNAYDDVGRYEDAIAAYKKAIALRPSAAFAIQALLLDYLAIGDRVDAAALLPKLTAVNKGLGKQMALIVAKVR